MWQDKQIKLEVFYSLSAKRSSVVLSQQSPPVNISAPLSGSEMMEHLMLEETAKASRTQSVAEEQIDEDESKR